ncbi:Protein kinase-like domain [Pseudocohnilembus persalinus]|uniref:Calcium-dependent protein kinase 1 n=1 Tax=Pseudocohnilembus persalinus TaxID=266149 RepID=A0A0V0R1X9_PSEPJ|nr:Protein kinase-like domain [Pseudocohnilembus persalinus]|eukprot:KRX08510.1 Protein kinase-like domain [Pseudocohnilembus persalinus]
MGPCNTKDKRKEEEESYTNQRPQKAPRPQPKSKKQEQNNYQQELVQQEQYSQQQQQQNSKYKDQGQQQKSQINNSSINTSKKLTGNNSTFDLEEDEQDYDDKMNHQLNVIQKRKNTTSINVNFTNADLVSEKYGQITNDYNLQDPPLGTGAFGEVRRAVHRGTGMTRAVKIIDKKLANQDELEKLKNEVEIMKQLDHPHIVKVYEYYQDPKYFYIVSEMCSGGELFDRIQEEGCFDEKKACQTITAVLQAINYCHKNGIIHRDLKPENLLFDVKGNDGMLKVIDFGTSLTFNAQTGEKLSQVLGTPYYIAPEVLKKNYNEKCDVWSLGVILYILLCGYPPFYGKTDKSIMKKVLKGKYSFEGYEWDIISEDAKDLISKMLVINPDERVSAEQALKHPWIKNQGIDQVDPKQMKQILLNMKGFRAQQKIQEAIYMFFVTFIATREEKNELLSTFKELDQNNDGKLTKAELFNGYKKFLNENEAKKTVDQVMDAIDINQSGAIDYTEFVMACLNRQNMLTPERMEKVFQAFDADGSGNLDLEEFKEVFGGNKIDNEVWKQIISEADADNNGNISFAEFKNTMIKLIN